MRSVVNRFFWLAIMLPALTIIGNPLQAGGVRQGRAPKPSRRSHAAPARVVVHDRSALLPPPDCCLAIPAGKTLSRSLELIARYPAGMPLLARAQPVLVTRPRARRAMAASGRRVTVPANGPIPLPLNIPIPQVTENTLLELVVSVRQGGAERYRETLPFVIVPPGPKGTQAQYEGRDDKTQGNWIGVYGQQAFSIPIAAGSANFQVAGIVLRRGTGMEPVADNPFDNRLEDQAQLINLTGSPEYGNVDDPRVPVEGPGVSVRAPIAYTAAIGLPLLMRVDTSDGQPHRLSLYVLDYRRQGLAMTLEVFDLQGHRLDRRRVDHYENGAYLRYRFTGSLILRLSSLSPALPALSGLFVDPAPGAGLLWH